jgi:type II secretory pathway component GspD/PulD (secretin)
MKNGLLYATSAARRALLLSLMLLTAVGITSCDRSGGTETRTFALKQLKPADALGLIEAYVPGGTQNIRSTQNPAAITVTAPRSRLDQVAQVLDRYDRVAPNAQLTFQVIEADGFTEKDPAIADVEGALRDLFKFTGYRLVASGLVVAHKPGSFNQKLGGGYLVTARVTEEGALNSANLSELRLWESESSVLLETTVNVPDGETVVVGSSNPGKGRNTIILVVRNKMK